MENSSNSTDIDKNWRILIDPSSQQVNIANNKKVTWPEVELIEE